jgi:hypothetical protein
LPVMRRGVWQPVEAGHVAVPSESPKGEAAATNFTLAPP